MSGGAVVVMGGTVSNVMLMARQPKYRLIVVIQREHQPSIVNHEAKAQTAARGARVTRDRSRPHPLSESPCHPVAAESASGAPAARRQVTPADCVFLLAPDRTADRDRSTGLRD